MTKMFSRGVIMGLDKKVLIMIPLVLTIHIEAEVKLTKTSPIVLEMCDKNSDGKVTGKEYVCYLDMKKKMAEEGSRKAKEGSRKAEEGLKKAEEEGKKLDEDIKKLEQKILQNK